MTEAVSTPLELYLLRYFSYFQPNSAMQLFQLVFERVAM